MDERVCPAVDSHVVAGVCNPGREVRCHFCKLPHGEERSPAVVMLQEVQDALKLASAGLDGPACTEWVKRFNVDAEHVFHNSR